MSAFRFHQSQLLLSNFERSRIWFDFLRALLEIRAIELGIELIFSIKGVFPNNDARCYFLFIRAEVKDARRHQDQQKANTDEYSPKRKVRSFFLRFPAHLTRHADSRRSLDSIDFLNEGNFNRETASDDGGISVVHDARVLRLMVRKSPESVDFQVVRAVVVDEEEFLLDLVIQVHNLHQQGLAIVALKVPFERILFFLASPRRRRIDETAVWADF